MTRTHIDYWEKWGGEEWAAMTEIVRSFNESQETYDPLDVNADRPGVLMVAAAYVECSYAMPLHQPKKRIPTA